VLRDVDGNEDERRGIVSVFNGPAPLVETFGSVADEQDAVRKAVRGWLAEGIAPHEIGIFVRTPDLVTRARSAVSDLDAAERVTTVPMHLAKGLEFRAVAIMACDEGTLPLDERVADAADEAELDEIFETERRLLYVACTRAREHLMVILFSGYRTVDFLFHTREAQQAAIWDQVGHIMSACGLAFGAMIAAAPILQYLARALGLNRFPATDEDHSFFATMLTPVLTFVFCGIAFMFTNGLVTDGYKQALLFLVMTTVASLVAGLFFRLFPRFAHA
jgi:hypothetical protein